MVLILNTSRDLQMSHVLFRVLMMMNVFNENQLVMRSV